MYRNKRMVLGWSPASAFNTHGPPHYRCPGPALLMCHTVTMRNSHLTEENIPHKNLALPSKVRLAAPIRFGNLHSLEPATAL